MPAAILATSGPLKGRTFPLPQGEWSVGRSSTNQLWLDDRAVSRSHCVFSTSGDQCELRDLGSHNRTFVNRQPVRSARLSPLDEIQIGESVFRFVVKDSETTAPDDSEVTQLRFEDSAYFSTADRNIPTSVRATHDLRTLLRLSTLLHSFRSLRGAQGTPAHEAIHERLGSLLLDLIPADRALVLTSNAETEREIVRRVRAERVALWVHETGANGSMSLAAPIIVQDDVPAVIYLESSDPAKRFDEGHLQFITAVAEMAAVAWENASILGWLQEENQRLQEELKLRHHMVGDSAKLAELQRQIAKVAPSNTNVLILGESGTGKELVARALHENSPRANLPFVAINCAALTDTLLESELFGHEKGSFTGALAQKKGKLEMADGGTVFLDEIGELQPPLQAKLLRVPQQRELERVGGTQTVKLNIRVVAATNRDLEQAVKSSAFRQDLYYRLNVVTLKTPPLRQRPEDILRLAEHFARKYAQDCGRRLIGIAPDARAYLRNYDWPGNVRELENAIESAVVLGSTEMIIAEDLPEQVRAIRPPT